MHNPYPPALYAKLHVGNPGDLAFYREHCVGASSILELGCGYGRVMESLSQAGRTVVGLDHDRGLLELARLRVQECNLVGCELVAGDMRSFQLDRSFDRILLPYSGLYCLFSDDDVVACLRRVREHLAPAGRFVFDAYCADGFHRCGIEDEDEDEQVADIEHEGRIYHVTESSQWDRKAQRLEVVYIHEPRSGGHSIATRLEHHYLLSEQLAPLLEAAGLVLTSLHGDYAGGPLHDDSDLLVATATAR